MIATNTPDPSENQMRLVKTLCRIYDLKEPTEDHVRRGFQAYYDSAINRYDPANFGFETGMEVL